MCYVDLLFCNLLHKEISVGIVRKICARTYQREGNGDDAEDGRSITVGISEPQLG